MVLAPRRPDQFPMGVEYPWGIFATANSVGQYPVGVSNDCTAMALFRLTQQHTLFNAWPTVHNNILLVLGDGWRNNDLHTFIADSRLGLGHLYKLVDNCGKPAAVIPNPMFYMAIWFYRKAMQFAYNGVLGNVIPFSLKFISNERATKTFSPPFCKQFDTLGGPRTNVHWFSFYPDPTVLAGPMQKIFDRRERTCLELVREQGQHPSLLPLSSGERGRREEN